METKVPRQSQSRLCGKARSFDLLPCRIASYLDDIRADLSDVASFAPIRDHDTPALFDWLIEVLSFQGISDAVASGYIAQHGTVRWSDIADALSRTPSCPKLGGYWRFYDCQYHKGSHTCSEPDHIDACPSPATRCATAA